VASGDSQAVLSSSRVGASREHDRLVITLSLNGPTTLVFTWTD
jgi:hypothetical protein